MAAHGADRAGSEGGEPVAIWRRMHQTRLGDREIHKQNPGPETHF